MSVAQVWFLFGLCYCFFCHLQINSYLTEQNEMYLSIVYSETVHPLVLACSCLFLLLSFILSLTCLSCLAI